MTTMPKSLAVFYFFSGLIVGLLLGLSVNKEWSTVLSRLLASCAIILVALFWRRVESLTHKRYVETWLVHRTRGKWRFIIMQYILMRGSVLTATVVLPAIPTLILTTNTLMIIIATLAVLVALLTYLGNESWSECEEDYRVQLLRQAAEQSRIASN